MSVSVRGDSLLRTLARMRALIHEALPDVEETWKWRGVPVWEKDGILCTGETYKQAVKLTFANGAALTDPNGFYGRDGLFRLTSDGLADRKLAILRVDPTGVTVIDEPPRTFAAGS